MHHFVQSLNESWPVERWQDTRVLVGVSGGADSIALLHALCELHPHPPESVFAIHVNHQWRGAESVGDAEFVADTCERLSVGLSVINATDYPDLSADQSEQAAREIRYRAFADTACHLGARFVVTAHTSDDQVETVMDRILRGTGVLGLSGIPRTREIAHGIVMIRPMLSFSRQQVGTFVSESGIEYRHDHSNEDMKYMRNRIRRELLPLIQRDYQSDAPSAILRLSSLATDLNEWVSEKITELWESVVLKDDSADVILDTAAFNDLAVFVKGQLLISIWENQRWPRRDMGREQWQRLIDLCLSESGTDEFSGAICAKKHDGRLSLTRRVE
ncbi:MAG: tRNA lysidine(34) synthetase TilS [Pirellulaceae bacterium]